MPIDSPSCAVAFPRERNNATADENATGNATATAPNVCKPASLKELRAQLRAQPERNQEAQPKDSVNPELRAAQLAAKASRQHVLDLLDRHPGTRYAVVVDNPDADPVLLTLAIRGQATCELAIPAAKFDAFLLLDLLARHGAQTVH